MELPRFPLGDSALYARLTKAPISALETLFGHELQLLTARLVPYQDLALAPGASEMLAVDETILDKVARLLLPLGGVPAGDRRLLPGRLTAAFDLRRQLWHATRRRVRVRAHRGCCNWSRTPRRAWQTRSVLGTLPLRTCTAR